MSSLLELGLSASGTVEKLGWVLIHSLWQFTLIALVAGVALRAMRRRSANARSAVLISLLVVSVALPLATWQVQRNATPRVDSNAAPMVVDKPTAQVATATGSDLSGMVGEPDSEGAIASSASASEVSGLAPATTDNPTRSEAVSQPAADFRHRSAEVLRPWLGWLVVVWGFGVALCSTRPVLGWLVLRRLRRVGVSAVSESVTRALETASKSLGLRRHVRLLQSSVARVPLVVGYFRPVILLPVSLLTSVPSTQLESILAHELAHIRRRDFIVNLLQVLAETVFFYHPAVWWLSRRIRVEREHCCDDMVVRALNNRSEYGRALIAVEELRGHGSLLALGASDGSLLARIRRIAGQPNERTGLSAGTGLCLIAALVGVVVWLGSTHDAAVAIADEPAATLALRPTLAQVAAANDKPLPQGATLRFGTSQFRHGDQIESMAISADGKIAIVARERHSRVYDLKTGRGLYSMNHGIDAAAISADCKTIVTKEYFSVSVRDGATGQVLRRFELPRFRSYSRTQWIKLTPDGKAVAVTSQGSVVHLLDVETGETIRAFSNDNPESKLSKSFSTVLGIAFSADGKLMASGGFANDQGTYFARLWDVETGKELKRFMHIKRSYGIPSLAISPDGKWMSTRSHDGCARVFDMQTAKVVHTFPKDGGGRKLGTVAFSPDSKTIAAAGDSLVLYDVESGEERVRIDRSQANNLAFTDNGATLTGAYRGAIYRWDTKTGKSLTPVGADSAISQVLATSDGKRVISQGFYGDIDIWDATTTKHLRHLSGPWQTKIAMSPDGRYLIWPATDRNVEIPDDPVKPTIISYGTRFRLYDMKAEEFVDRFVSSESDGAELEFTSDGRQLLSVCHRDGVVHVWDFEAGKILRSFTTVPEAEKRYMRQVSNAVLSPDGKTLMIGYTPHENWFVDEQGRRVDRLGRLQRPRPARAWDVATGKEKYQLENAYGAMAFSPNSKLFVSSNGAVIDPSTGKRIAALLSSPHIRDLAFSRDGRVLATAVSGDKIQIWDATTWTKRGELEGHARLAALTFCPDQRLLSGSGDTTLLAWDLGGN